MNNCGDDSGDKTECDLPVFESLRSPFPAVATWLHIAITKYLEQIEALKKPSISGR
jgi:hypothetical protein